MNVNQPMVTQEQPVIATPAVNIEQPVIQNQQQSITQPLEQQTLGVSIDDLNIPAVEVNQQSPVISMEQPVIESAETVKFTPAPTNPNGIEATQSTSVSTNQTTKCTGGAVSITNHFTINANTQESGEEIEAIIERVMQKQLNEMPERLLTQ